MNPSRPHPLSEAEDQAALWAARLDGSDLGPADRAELEAWLAVDPARAELLERYRQLSSDLGELLPSLVAAGGAAPASPPPRRLWNPWALVSAGLLATAAALVAVVLVRPGRHGDTIATAVAQRRQFTLADGSRVELNANTSMVVENGSAERRVRLANGEAFFIVSKDARRPFIVETPAGSVRVTGTIFNVRTEAETELEVTVVEGSVQVRPGGDPAGELHRMGPGDCLSSSGRDVTLRRVSGAAVEDLLAWRQGAIVFTGTPLPEALARVGRYYGRQFTASPAAAAAGLKLGGRYPTDNLDEFFGGIEQTLKVRATYDASGAVRVILRSEQPSPGFR
jgi:transmembrane sensor